MSCRQDPQRENMKWVSIMLMMAELEMVLSITMLNFAPPPPPPPPPSIKKTNTQKPNNNNRKTKSRKKKRDLQSRGEERPKMSSL